MLAVQTWWCFQGGLRWSKCSAGCARMGLGNLEIGFDQRAHSWWFPRTRLKRVGKQVSLMKIRSMRTCWTVQKVCALKISYWHVMKIMYFMLLDDRKQISQLDLLSATSTNGLALLPLWALSKCTCQYTSCISSHVKATESTQSMLSVS